MISKRLFVISIVLYDSHTWLDYLSMEFKTMNQQFRFPLTFILLLSVSLVSCYEISIIKTEQNFRLVARDWLGQTTPHHSQHTRSLVECMRVCLGLDYTVFVITFVPDKIDNCRCSQQWAMSNRVYHKGTVIYQSRHSKFLSHLYFN